MICKTNARAFCFPSEFSLTLEQKKYTFFVLLVHVSMY